MALQHTRIGISKTNILAAGTEVFGVWRDLAVPGEDALAAALGDLGEVWFFFFLDLPHVVVKLNKDQTELDFTLRLYVASGKRVPYCSVIRGTENYRAATAYTEAMSQAAKRLAQSVSEGAQSITSGTLWIARWGMWLLGGAVVLVLAIWLWGHYKKEHG